MGLVSIFASVSKFNSIPLSPSLAKEIVLADKFIVSVFVEIVLSLALIEILSKAEISILLSIAFSEERLPSICILLAFSRLNFEAIILISLKLISLPLALILAVELLFKLVVPIKFIVPIVVLYVGLLLF